MRAGAVPLLVARAESGPNHGAVLWYHGFGVDKETHHAELARFAHAGFTAIGVDAVGHGERRAADLDERRAGTQAEAFHSVIEMATATAAELPSLVDLLRSRDVVSDRVAVAGISMGAFIVYRALVEEPRLAAAVAILGSPEWPTSASPHTRAPLLCRVPLLSITAAGDTSVPPAPARRLHERLEEICPADHRYVELRDAVHLMNADDWETTMRETLNWLTVHMAHT